jgi:hypothetical protein
VVIHSTGYADLAGSKRIEVDAEGIHSRPARASAATYTSINDISHRIQVIERIAWKQARRQKARAEGIASSRAASRLAQQMNQRAHEMLAEPRDTFATKFRYPLLRRGEFPQMFELATTTDRINVRMLQANMFQLAAPSSPPEIEAHDVDVRLHESFVGNFSEAMIGGFELTDERLVEILEENNREVPDELLIDPSKDPWSITFANQQPVRVEIGDQRLKVTIRGRRFTRGEQVVSAEMDIWAVYLLERTAEGATLTREGEVQAEYTKGGFENAAQIAIKTLMRRKFDALFKTEIAGEGINLGGRWDEAGTLKLAHLDASSGWLSLGWNLKPASAETTASLP